MDHIEARCICYVEVGTLDGLEQSKLCVFTINTLGMAMLTIHHDMIFSVCFNKDPTDSSDKHQQTSFPMKNVPFLSPKNEISAVVHCSESLQTNTQHQTELVQIA